MLGTRALWWVLTVPTISTSWLGTSLFSCMYGGGLEMLRGLCFLPYEATLAHPQFLGATSSFLYPAPIPSYISDEAKRCGDAGTTGPTEVAMGTPATCAASLGMLRRGYRQLLGAWLPLEAESLSCSSRPDHHSAQLQELQTEQLFS